MRKGHIKRYAKYGGIARRRFSAVCETPEREGVQPPPPSPGPVRVKKHMLENPQPGPAETKPSQTNRQWVQANQILCISINEYANFMEDRIILVHLRQL